MLPNTIDEVVARLNDIIDGALREGSRIGYFAALYERVTTNVRRALVAGDVFEDNTRMERLDVTFANRFLEAWGEFGAGRRPSASWRVAFELLGDPAPLVVQHLMLGMNAHINLDLGVAAAEVAPTFEGLQSLKPDFLTINEILGRLLGVVELELGQICPRFSRAQRLTFFAPHLGDKLFGFGMGAARDLAWLLAEQVVAAGDSGREHVIAKRDAETAVVGKTLYPLQGFADRVAQWIHASECADVRDNIQVIAG
ncbi:MAG TPA: DUF5995 family protein [Pyrinomonadaceae bacterium]|nr:DUF5995 family protein [Pyrinomonadaceae bacterium]